jgi:pSer/pThr/pTyr-binding forkhead associated (FHA) protein
MKKIVLRIDSDDERREVTLDDEISIGRTNSAQLVLPDSGLSRLNTTFFRDGDEIFVVDENSTNGTFVNGEQVFSEPQKLNDGDEITTGSNTRIYLKITEKQEVKPTQPQPNQPKGKKTKKTGKPKVEEDKLPIIPIVAGGSIFLIVLVALLALLFIKPKPGNNFPNGQPTAQVSGGLIPQRVIDPLGGDDPENDVDELIALLERDISDEGVNIKDLEEMQTSMQTSTAPVENKDAELQVKPEVFAEMMRLSKEPRHPSGERPPGLNVLPELCCNVPKQTAKLTEMINRTPPYTQPLDFADLAERRLNGQLIELPVATPDYVLDVGGNATEAEFNEFSWETSPRSIPLSPNSNKYKILQRLAENFGGQKYDLSNPKHRLQMKIRLLRMFNPTAKPILMEFAKKYRERFNRPLRITSLTRSMEYQISLNGNNPNSFPVRGKGSLPPHTSGCAFDLARKQMTVDEQNFMIETLAEMEKRGILDGLIEYNANACFHIFIYDDGKKPKGF